MPNGTRIRLLEVEPDLARHLSEEERIAATQLTVPVEEVATGPIDVDALLGGTSAFGALVLEGLILRDLVIGEHAGLRLLGPGDLLSESSEPASMLLASAGYSAASRSRVALLGNEVLVAAHRWPRLVAGFYARATEQAERVAVQLAICQLPRVEDRILALLWLLAESWGRVTAVGTTLPLSLTHETLGGLVGARRPTVTLAVGELVQRGAVVRQGRGWLLLERPSVNGGAPASVQLPELLGAGGTRWGVRDGSPPPAPAIVGGPGDGVGEIAANVARLRTRHRALSARLPVELARAADSRRRSVEIREQVRESRRRRDAE